MLPADRRKRPVEVAGWELEVTSYQIGTRYLAEVEAVSSGVTIARAIDDARFIAEKLAIQTAALRLTRPRPIDLDLTVGG
jgi:hypothetical protein